ncbi:DNA/RNA non-specific endonuclease [Adhaeribacter terreus]|uniref:DNA/RNA non-specific endonuclease n=1 Tax=Adhaeribacter terreus TaxID=529703 RepID=A0ABW0EEC1_9BACT
MRKQISYFFLVLLLGCAVTSCKEDNVTPDNTNPVENPQHVPLGTIVGFPEDFEATTKFGYPTDTITLGSGDWILDDALIGTSADDRRNGYQSVRIRYTGKVTMNFASPKGVSTVTVNHARYGNDPESEWELWVSHNGGEFMKVGETVKSTATTLQKATFTVNLTGSVKFEIRKISSGTARLNIDDFSFKGYGLAGDTDGTYDAPEPVINEPLPTDNLHIGMGNPSNATNNVANFANYLMQKNEYDLSYHRDRGIPNWVSWHLDRTWIGSAPRQDNFRADNTLPAGWYRVIQTSYSSTGFDRGHNCPSADRSSTTIINSATFLMTNMIPQAPNNNQQIWADLENYTRSLVNKGNEVYVIMGSYGEGGTGSKGGLTKTINGGKVTVPSNVWKVIVVLPEGNGDVNRVNNTTRIIAVNTPNINSVSSSWGTYRTSVDAIEAATGYDLLSNLPEAVQTAVEAKTDNGPTN